MAIFAGTFQHDNGLGEFCQSIASRALTLATNFSVSAKRAAQLGASALAPRPRGPGNQMKRRQFISLAVAGRSGIPNSGQEAKLCDGIDRGPTYIKRLPATRGSVNNQQPLATNACFAV